MATQIVLADIPQKGKERAGPHQGSGYIIQPSSTAMPMKAPKTLAPYWNRARGEFPVSVPKTTETRNAKITIAGK